MRQTRVTTKTDIPTVFHTEFVEAAEAGTAVGVEEGATVGFQEVMSSAARGAGDETSERLCGVGEKIGGSADEGGV